MADLSKADLAEMKADLREYIKERCDGIDDRLDYANGRTRTLETKVAVLEERSGGKQGAVAGGIVAGIAGVFELLRHLLTKP